MLTRLTMLIVMTWGYYAMLNFQTVGYYAEYTDYADYTDYANWYISWHRLPVFMLVDPWMSILDSLTMLTLQTSGYYADFPDCGLLC